MATTLVIGLSGCASTQESDTETTADNGSTKASQQCKKVRSTGSNIGRCQK
ncbi:MULTISPECIES: hypothetical protein [Shewanella]|uniref:hypothetical protein n=1 Tax=Shewanella TaxID=22 RepID=UPI001643280F|nr:MULTISPECIES: hypothetical protein [Shewanella]QYJ84518.1 hypothetical protein K0H80_18095 [Shewanella aegiceratis]QYJ92055.1 hypothetical protein K0H81_18480 [Shewanella halotolerans]QYJ95937.1 hypothetical protein K0I31_18300 [Shewanella spartinae]QYK15043.1 hypothetical protein K0I63_18270 [Shewanella rhizosphaerae]